LSSSAIFRNETLNDICLSRAFCLCMHITFSSESRTLNYFMFFLNFPALMTRRKVINSLLW
jgi:hypothetical protein